MRSPRPPLPVLLGIVAAGRARAGRAAARSASGPRTALGRGHAGARGRAGARLRARRGRGHRRRGRWKTSAAPASATCWRSRGQNVTLLALLAMPLLARARDPAARAPGLGARPDRRLRAAGRRRPVDPAGRGDGRGRACWRRWRAGAPRASTRWRWRCGRDPGDRPRRRRRRRLAAQLRRGRSGSSCWPRRCGEAIAARIGAGGWRRALAEGAAVTIAATLATAPELLMK